MQSERDAINAIVDGAVGFWELNEFAPRETAPSFEEIGENLSERLAENENNGVKVDYNLEIENRYFEEDLAKRWENKIAEGVDENVWSPENPHIHQGYTRHAPFLYNWIEPKIWQDWKFWAVVNKAIEAGEKIRRIAQAAYTNGITVRWFDYNPAEPTEAILNDLHVLSAGQITKVRPDISLFHFLSLTVVNKESLVLYSPPDSDSPGVLFCADSDLESLQLPVVENDLVTAPHHGAESNELAYDRIKNSISPRDFDSLVWVRSDSQSRKRPCLTYKNLTGQKFCTVCTFGPPKRPVKLNGINNLWRRQRGVSICSC